MNEALKNKYPSKKIDDELFFQAPNGRVFTVGVFLHFKSIQLEYADSFEKSRGGREDGDLFSIDLDKDSMLTAIMDEVERQ